VQRQPGSREDSARPRWIGPGGRARDDYRPLRPATSVLRLVVGVIALTGVALAAVSVVVWRRLGGEVTMIALPNTSIDWAVLQSWLQGLAVVQLALLVVASVLMIRWTAQASHNVAKLRVGGHTIASVWATLGWLIPGVNLVLPRQVVVQLWRTADRTGEVLGLSHRLGERLAHLPLVQDVLAFFAARDLIQRRLGTRRRG